MKKLIMIAMATIATVFTCFAGGVKVMDRLADVSETAEIFVDKQNEKPLFIDITDLAPTFKSRFYKNPRFERIDLSEVKKGKIVAKSGAESYTKEEYSKETSDLYKLNEKDVFVDVLSIPEDQRRKITDSDNFKHIGMSAFTIEGEREKSIKKLTDELTKLLGIEETDRQAYTENVTKILNEYERAKTKNFDILTNTLTKDIERFKATGDLNKTQNALKMKEDIISDKFSESDLTGEAKAAWVVYKKSMGYETKKYVTALEAQISYETKNGKIALASRIKKELVEGVDKRFLEAVEEVKGSGNVVVGRKGKGENMPVGKWTQLEGPRWIEVNKNGTWFSNYENLGGTWRRDGENAIFTSNKGNNFDFTVPVSVKEYTFDWKKSHPVMRWSEN
jgi:hypothetical protein